MKAMTMRERLLAVIQGRPHDRVPFFMYDMMFPRADLDAVLRPDQIGLMRWSNVHRVEHPHCRFDKQGFQRDGLRWERTTLHTLKGSIYQEMAFEPAYDSGSIRKHYVTDLADYPVLWAYLEDCQIIEDYDRYHRDQADLGDRGLPLVAVERTAWQQLWVQWVGLDVLGYHLADDPDRVQHTVALLEARQRRIFELAYRSPAPFVDFPDNITAPTIGPRRFRQYCVPMYDELGGMLEERGAVAFCHMDGDLKPLWADIAACKIRGLDSFSPQPDNDTSVAEAISIWPEKRLFVNFPSSVHLMAPDQVRAHADAMLAVAGHSGRLEIQISENVPHGVWRTTLPIIAQAVEDFGAP
jgi:hypothetical protein